MDIQTELERIKLISRSYLHSADVRSEFILHKLHIHAIYMHSFQYN